MRLALRLPFFPTLAIAVFVTMLTTSAEAARTHVVERGETLTSIAQEYSVGIAELARANKLQDRDLLRRGQRLQIPDNAAAFVEHRVVAGESLARIAQRYRTSVADLRAHNHLPNPNRIVPGQMLRVPATKAAGSADARWPLPANTQTVIDSTAVTARRWQHIVIHHSGTPMGSSQGMDRYHREERRMENGLAYHFVIGNGNGMADGEIDVGRRWIDQIAGGHLAIEALNQVSLGICLVGDFQRKPPTRRQLDALEALVRALQRKAGLPVSAVTTHQKIHPGHTQCPGRFFPMEAFVKRLQQR